MNALLHGVENFEAELVSICQQRVPPRYHIVPTLFAPGGQRQTVWGVIKTVCLVWPAAATANPRATVTLCLYPKPAFCICLIPTMSCFQAALFQQHHESLFWKREGPAKLFSPLIRADPFNFWSHCSFFIGPRFDLYLPFSIPPSSMVGKTDTLGVTLVFDDGDISAPAASQFFLL